MLKPWKSKPPPACASLILEYIDAKKPRAATSYYSWRLPWNNKSSYYHCFCCLQQMDLLLHQQLHPLVKMSSCNVSSHPRHWSLDRWILTNRSWPGLSLRGYTNWNNRHNSAFCPIWIWGASFHGASFHDWGASFHSHSLFLEQAQLQLIKELTTVPTPLPLHFHPIDQLSSSWGYPWFSSSCE